MPYHFYKTEQLLPTDPETAWAFFSSAKNLARITPPGLDFKILTKLGDEEIYNGMLIDYIVRPLLGIPLRWQTEIVRVDRLHAFTDRQRKGPYSFWEHTHTFIQREDGILMMDEVQYKMPLGPLGELAHGLMVRSRLQHIFNYRREVLRKIFSRQEGHKT